MVGSFHVCNSEKDKSLDYKLVQTELTWPDSLPGETRSPVETDDCTSREPRIGCILIAGHLNATYLLVCFFCKLGIAVYNVKQMTQTSQTWLYREGFPLLWAKPFWKKKNVLTNLDNFILRLTGSGKLSWSGPKLYGLQRVWAGKQAWGSVAGARDSLI